MENGGVTSPSPPIRRIPDSLDNTLSSETRQVQRYGPQPLSEGEALRNRVCSPHLAIHPGQHNCFTAMLPQSFIHI